MKFIVNFPELMMFVTLGIAFSIHCDFLMTLASPWTQR